MTMSANKRCQNAVTLEGSMRVELTGSWVGNIVGFHGCRFCDKWLVKSKYKVQSLIILTSVVGNIVCRGANMKIEIRLGVKEMTTMLAKLTGSTVGSWVGDGEVASVGVKVGSVV